MNVQSNVKKYWVRQGPKAIFGSDWQERLGMTDEHLERRFDLAWERRIEPALEHSTVLDPEEALEMIPNDRRRDHFSGDQEHRKVTVCGEEMIVQIEPLTDTVTQLWHLHAKRPKPEIKASESLEPIGDDPEDSFFPGPTLRRDVDSEVDLARRLVEEDAKKAEDTGKSDGNQRPFDWLCDRAALTPEQLRRVLAKINEHALALVG